MVHIAFDSPDLLDLGTINSCMTIEGIILLGQSLEHAGRGIAGFRLRTAAEKAGFEIKVIDYASFLNQEEILSIIDAYVKKGIKFVGISTAWSYSNVDSRSYNWINIIFFLYLKKKIP